MASEEAPGVAATAGDFDGWIATRSAALTRFAYLVTGSQDAADDALQSALVKACERWPRVSRVSDPDAYVRRMIVNAHISWWRRFARRESAVGEVRPDGGGLDPAGAVARHDAVWRLCATLPSRQRAALVLKYYEDLTYVEIAAVLDCPEATARSYVSRALAALRRTLDSQESSDG